MPVGPLPENWKVLDGGGQEKPRRQDVALRGLRALREAAGLTQQELAKRLGIKQQSLWKIERTQTIGVQTLVRYVRAVGGTLEIHATLRGKRTRLLP